jgi:hypothetical protein
MAQYDLFALKSEQRISYAHVRCVCNFYDGQLLNMTTKDLEPVLDGVAVIIKERDEKLNARLELAETKIQASASAVSVAELIGEIQLLKARIATLETRADATKRHLQNVDGRMAKYRGE